MPPSVFGVSAGDVIGPVRRDPAKYSGVIAAGDAEAVAAYAGVVKRFGARQVKVKVGPDLDNNLRVLEAEWNARKDEHPYFADTEHPINLNFGMIIRTITPLGPDRTQATSWHVAPRGLDQQSLQPGFRS